MKLTVTNTNISNSLLPGKLSINNYSVDGNLPGNVTVNSTALIVGNSFVNSTTISVDNLIAGGVAYVPGGTTGYGAIVNTQIFTSNGIWTNPTANATLGLNGNAQVFIMMWGGGGAGNSGATPAGGGGGACVVTTLRLSDCNTVCNVVVGLGGTSGSGDNTIFYPNTTLAITAYGGGSGTTNDFDGGGGGGLFDKGSSSTGRGGGPLGGNTTVGLGVSTFGGGQGGNTTSQEGKLSIFGGGGGAYGLAQGGNSVYGGAGGGGPPGISAFGGNGGSISSSYTAGSVPGGGGGAWTGAGQYGAGGRGEVRIWVMK